MWGRRKGRKTRPGVDHAKDWLNQIFPSIKLSEISSLKRWARKHFAPKDKML